MPHPRLGFLYPGHAAEDDYPRLAQDIGGIDVRVVHTSVGEDAHRIDALLDLGGDARLRAGAEALRGLVDVAMWACTSGSFVFGWEGARRQAALVADVLGVPASSTSLAFAHAVTALGLGRVAVAATYPADVAEAFREFLQTGAAVEVVRIGSEDVITAAEVGTFDEDRVVQVVQRHDAPEAEAILVPDTALHTVAWLPTLEGAVGKPVLTANQVTMWEALRLADALRPVAGLGTLFREGMPQR